MRSASDCFQISAQIEAKARAASNDADRVALEATAKQWRTLGEHAKVVETEKPLLQPQTNK
jgi:hypothetical protein